MEKELIDVKGITLHFNLREPRNKYTNIYAVLRLGMRQTKIPMPYKVKSWLWDKKKEIPLTNSEMTSDEIANAKEIYNAISLLRLAYSDFFVYFCNDNVLLTADEVISYFKNCVRNNIINSIMAKNGVPNVRREKSATKALKKALELYPEVKDGVAASTLATYGHQLKAFCNYCEDIKRNSIRMLTTQGLNDFEIYLRGKGESATKIRSSLRIVRILVNKVMCKHPYFRNYGVLKVDVSLPANVSSEDLKVELLDEEIDALKNCQGLTSSQEEYRDLFLLEFYTGQRASDLHIFFDPTKYKVIDGYMAFKTKKKGTKGKTEMTPEVMSIIDKYPNGFKYAKVEKEKFSADLTNKLKIIAKKANLNRIIDYTDNKKQTHSDPLYMVIASHFGRHTFCTRKVREGVPLETLKFLTAHANTQTLQNYYVHLTDQDEVNVIKKDKEKRSGVIRQSDEDKVKEYKDVLAFYKEPYINYRYINDSEELLRLIVSKYEMRLKDKGYTTEVLKKIYNSQSMEDRDKYEKLLKTLDEIAAESEI